MDSLRLERLKDIELEGIDTNDYPDFVDAFISSASLGGKELSDQELDDLNDNYPDFVYDCVISHLF